MFGRKGVTMAKWLNNRLDLTQGPVFKGLMAFSIPILLGTVVTQLYNVADSVIVGKMVGADALAAVSAGSPVMSLINMFLIGLSAGSNVIIAQRYGAKNEEALKKAINTVGFLTLACSAFITIAGLAVVRPLLNLLGTPSEISRDAEIYLIIIYIGTTGNLIYQMGSGALRGMGDALWPFLFLVLCSVLNVILDAVFVLLGWGVGGVAAATAFSQLVSGVGIILRINRGGYGVRVSFRNLKPDKKECKEIAAIGLPAAIQNIGNAIANLCVQSSVNFFGSAFIAANSIVTKVDDLVYIPITAVSTALCTFVAQNMGTFNMQRIKKGINQSILSLTALGAVLCVLLLGLRNVFPLAFTNDPEVVSYASVGLMVMSFVCLFHGVDRCLVNAMRGAGKSVVPMITAQFGAFSRIPLAYFLGVYMNNWKGIFWALALASVLRSVAIAFYYYLGGWKKAVQKFEEKHHDKVSVDH